MDENYNLSPEERADLAFQAKVELVKRYAADKDILNWGRTLFPDKFSLPFCPELHEYIVQTRFEPFLDLEAPRNHSKTTIACFLIPIFQALEEPWKYNHYLNVQKTETKALSCNTAIKEEFESNELLRAVYGDCHQRASRWTDMQFVVRVKKPNREKLYQVIFTAIGAGQSVRGISYCNIRPDYILGDDLYDDVDINNIESTLKINAWFWSSLFPARAKSKESCVHVLGTAINHEDLLEKLKTKPRWVSRTFRAIKSWSKKVVLWPQLNSWEDLMADKVDMGTTVFMREMQNERRDDSESLIKEEWIQEYDPHKLIFNEDLILEEILLGCDPSIGKEKKTKSTSDFTGIALVYKCRNKEGANFYYIVKVWNERLSMYRRVKKLSSIYSDQPENMRIGTVFIEGISGFQDFVSEVQRTTNLPVRLIDHVKDKITNLENKAKHWENGKVFINQSMDGELKDALVHQLTTNYPKHDDIRDAVLLCIEEGGGADIIMV